MNGSGRYRSISVTAGRESERSKTTSHFLLKELQHKYLLKSSAFHIENTILQAEILTVFDLISDA